MAGFFHEIKIIYTNHCPKKDKEKDREEVICFYRKVATFSWDPDRWRWGDGGRFLKYTTKSGRDIIASRNPGAIRRRPSDKATSRFIIDFINHMFGIPFVWTKNMNSFCPFGT